MRISFTFMFPPNLTADFTDPSIPPSRFITDYDGSNDDGSNDDGSKYEEFADGIAISYEVITESSPALFQSVRTHQNYTLKGLGSEPSATGSTPGAHIVTNGYRNGGTLIQEWSVGDSTPTRQPVSYRTIKSIFGPTIAYSSGAKRYGPSLAKQRYLPLKRTIANG
ncbi:hypothetical protein N0V90_001529 [Kalmusia sp. IMI 367209]|nr:hypothetical protein N0V90_001529 [Kalmusia sp. IMI 367209]